ncbi:MAG: hypothetical protein COA39_007150 [Sulfurimonas sp.]|nr:hypothetical protein [Sulfurimonas sp.]
MNIINNLINLIYEKTSIKVSRAEGVFTRFGMYQVKAYKDSEREYLVLMSQNFFELKTPIVHIFSALHVCGSSMHQMYLAMQMISKEGGVVIYHSDNGSNIDTLLYKINMKKVQTTKSVRRKAKKKPGIKVPYKEYRTLGFIFTDLNLTRIKLVSNDLKTTQVIQELGIEITAKVSAISTVYSEE